MGVETVYILGGETRVSKEIESELKNLKLKIERVSGTNRFETAAQIARKASKKTDVFLVLGKKLLSDGSEDSLADALAIGPVSANKSMPILLTKKDKLPEETKEAIKNFSVNKITIVGGENAISKSVEAELIGMKVTVDRVEGSNRYNTAIQIAKKYLSNPSNIVIANGKSDSDALVGGYFAVKNNASIILTGKDGASIETLNYIKKIKVKSFLLGGEAAISDIVLNQVESARKGIIEKPAKPAPVPEPKPEVKPEPKPEVKPEPKPEPEPEPEVKPEPKPEVKPEPKPEVKPVAKPIICLDYGHGGTDSGASYKGRKEKDDTLKIGKLIALDLRRHGVTVDETRVSDKTLSLRERSRFENKKNYNYLVSIHRNAIAPERAHGVETFTYPTASWKAVKLARVMQKNLVDVGFNDRKVKTANFHMLRETRAPAVLVEIGFIDHTKDNILYDAKQAQIVKAISSAVLGELGIKYKN